MLVLDVVSRRAGGGGINRGRDRRLGQAGLQVGDGGGCGCNVLLSDMGQSWYVRASTVVTL